MENTGQDASHGKNGFSGRIFEQHFYRSLSLLLKNVSDYFYLLEENVTFLNHDSRADHQIQSGDTSEFKRQSLVSESIWLICYVSVITGVVWILNRNIFKSSTLQFLTTLILSWLLVILTIPIVILPMTLIIMARIVISVILKQSYKDRLQLMTPFDAVWSFEKSNSTSTCVGLYVIKGDGDLLRIRHLLCTRVLEKKDVHGNRIYDRFRWSIVKCWGFMCWNKDTQHFKLHEHIRYFEGVRKKSSEEWTYEDIFEELGNIQDISLNQNQNNKSPWEILIIPKFKLTLDSHAQNNKENHYAIVFRIHHSIADGISMGHILHSGIADAPFTFSIDPITPLNVSKFTVVVGYIVAFLVLPYITLRNLIFFETNAFHTERSLTGPKRFTWSRPIRLGTIKELKTRSKSSVFAVLLSCLTGSMRRLYIKHGHLVPEVIHACPPVAILPYPDRNPRNRFSVVLFPLATGKEDPIERVDATFTASKKLASSPDVLSNYFAVYLLGLLPFVFLKILAPLAHATITFSNIPGPTEKVIVLNGDELVEIGAWIPIKNRIGIAMALFSYNDKLRVTFISDKACLSNLDDLELLRNYFETEVLTLSDVLGVDKTQIFI